MVLYIVDSIFDIVDVFDGVLILWEVIIEVNKLFGVDWI